MSLRLKEFAQGFFLKTFLCKGVVSSLRNSVFLCDKSGLCSHYCSARSLPSKSTNRFITNNAPVPWCPNLVRFGHLIKFKRQVVIPLPLALIWCCRLVFTTPLCQENLFGLCRLFSAASRMTYFYFVETGLPSMPHLSMEITMPVIPKDLWPSGIRCSLSNYNARGY